MSTYQHSAECKTYMMNKIIEKSSVKRYTNQLFYFYLCRDKAIVDMFFNVGYDCEWMWSQCFCQCVPMCIFCWCARLFDCQRFFICREFEDTLQSKTAPDLQARKSGICNARIFCALRTRPLREGRTQALQRTRNRWERICLSARSMP